MPSEFGNSQGTYGDLNFVTTKQTKTVNGLKFPVKTSNTGGMFARNVDAQAIKDGLLQLIMTQNGERPMRYDYGTALRRSVFAPLDSTTVSDLTASIQNAINTYEPRVIIRVLEVIPDEATSSLSINLVFSIKNDVFHTQQIALTVDARGVQVNG